ncbi:MAG TPA: hypothetical protein VNH53_11895 [Sphingomicrobium sp.]|jgi:hypothetical protein|nr:hypothetical protein [Sphingomicrobium sp.]
MDGYRDFPSDFEPSTASEASPESDVAAAIGTDERRMHVRAYNYWVSLLDGRDYPSIEDLEPGDLKDFADNSVLLDFTAGRDNPATAYIGAAIREECDLAEDIRTIGDVPSRSLLSRLTDHYLQIIANRAPIGFEAEYVNQRGDNICYRGILMPFSSDGDTIDFIYGVINWKRVGEQPADIAPGEAVEADGAAQQAPVADELGMPEPAEPEAEQPPVAEPIVQQPAEQSDLPAIEIEQPPVHFSWEDGPLADADEIDAPAIMLGEDAGLADRLWAARETAEAAKAADGRTRAALYRALSLAYDFALASQRMPEDYAELLEESGVKAQARAPMTPIVKLVFGIDYDKTRLTEFAAALSYAQRQDIALGGFLDFIEKTPGGLKALVAAERQARRPEARPDNSETARARLRAAAPIALEEIRSDDEFSLVLTRRAGDGGQEAVAVIDDPAMVERAIRRAAA